MSSVQIFHRAPSGEETLVAVIDGDRIKAHCAAIRDLIATEPPAIIYTVTLAGPNFEALKVVVEAIAALDSRDVLKINITTRDLVKAIQIHCVTHGLRIEPPQDQIAGHLNGFLSHQLVTAREMIAVHTYYSAPNNPNIKIWKTMIHTVAWKFVAGEMTADEQSALKTAAVGLPALDTAIDSKVKELQAMKKNREHKEAKKRAKKAMGEEGVSGTRSQ